MQKLIILAALAAAPVSSEIALIHATYAPIITARYAIFRQTVAPLPCPTPCEISISEYETSINDMLNESKWLSQENGATTMEKNTQIQVKNGSVDIKYVESVSMGVRIRQRSGTFVADDGSTITKGLLLKQNIKYKRKLEIITRAKRESYEYLDPVTRRTIDAFLEHFPMSRKSDMRDMKESYRDWCLSGQSSNYYRFPSGFTCRVERRGTGEDYEGSYAFNYEVEKPVAEAVP